MSASSSLNNPLSASDDLYAGAVKTLPLKLKAGTYVRGEVVETDTAVDALQTLATASLASAVIVQGITLAADTVVPVYVAGDFNEDALVLGAVPLGGVKTALRDRGIFARKWGAAPASA